MTIDVASLIGEDRCCLSTRAGTEKALNDTVQR